MRNTDCAENLDDINVGKFLFVGCKGNAVGQLQKILGMQSITYEFDQETKKALMSYQLKHHLKNDGILGRDTYSTISINVK